MFGPGTVIDRYELVRSLAAGGMGEVYLARLQSVAGFGSLVAIKVLIPNLSTNNAFVSMFLDEARHVAKLRHKNIVQIRDIAEHGGQYYMVMEYIPGQNLRELLGDVSIVDHPFFEPKLGAEVFADIASALATVHSAGLVHRDMSPNNIMVGDDGVAKLIDFGVARALDTASLTNPGTLKGKFTYMAPEYIRSDGYDHRADIFSLGVVMWETFARRRLFRGTSAAEQLHQVLEGTIPRLDEALPGFPIELADLVAEALERDPRRRMASAAELADLLRNVALVLPDSQDLSLRKWLERRIGDRIEQRRRDSQATLTSRSPTIPDPGFVEIEIQGATTPVPRTNTPLPARPSGFFPAGASGNSATSIRLANGEAERAGNLRPRALSRVVAPFALVAIVIVIAVAFVRRGGDAEPARAARETAPAAAPAASPSPIDVHRQAGVAAMSAKDYTKAISEFAEALRHGGGSDVIQLMEMARKQQREASPHGAAPTAAAPRDVQTK